MSEGTSGVGQLNGSSYLPREPSRLIPILLKRLRVERFTALWTASGFLDLAKVVPAVLAQEAAERSSVRANASEPHHMAEVHEYRRDHWNKTEQSKWFVPTPIGDRHGYGGQPQREETHKCHGDAAGVHVRHRLWEPSVPCHAASIRPRARLPGRRPNPYAAIPSPNWMLAPPVALLALLRTAVT